MKFWARRRLLSTVMAMVVTASTPALAANRCLNPAEAEAYRTRLVQTELMVAALKCTNRPRLELPQIYNAFVVANSPALVAKAKLLSAYFKRQYGPDFERQQDSFITGLANRISVATNRDPNFCRAAAARGRLLTAPRGDPPRPARLDRPRLAAAGLALCPAVAGAAVAPPASPAE